MTVPFLSVKPKAVKLKVAPRFPALLIGRTGIAVNKAAGNYYLDLAYQDLPFSPTVPAGTQVVVYDPVSGHYTTIPALQLGGGITTDAPLDGFTYGRSNAAWDKALSLANGGVVAGNVTFNGTAAFTNTTTAPTPAPGDNSTKVATTAFVSVSFAPINSPAFTGTPTAPTPAPGDTSTRVATTAFVSASFAPLASPIFTGTVTINGRLVLSGILSPPSIGGNQNDYNPTGLAANSILRLTASAPVNITGLAAQPNGTVVALVNIGSNTITLTNLDAASLAANQFAIGPNIPLAASQGALFFYDGVSSKWRPLAGAGAGGGGGASVYVQDTAPVGATAGSLWWNSSNGQLYLLYYDGNSTQWVFASSSVASGGSGIVRSYLSGLTLSLPTTTTFSVAAGVAADSTNVDMMSLPAAITGKTTGAWSAGNGGGALDTGTISGSVQWYHIFVIKNPSTQIVDVVFSLSPTAPTLPSGFTLFRRIGSWRWAVSQWSACLQNGDEFIWNVNFNEMSGATPPTAFTLLSLAGVPTGVSVQVTLDVASQIALKLASGLVTGSLTAFAAYTVGNNANTQVKLTTDTSARIWWKGGAATTGTTMDTMSYIDRRGRDN
jgi:hypothetical protein